MAIDGPNNVNAVENVKPNNTSLGKVNDAEVREKANSVHFYGLQRLLQKMHILH